MTLASGVIALIGFYIVSSLSLCIIAVLFFDSFLKSYEHTTLWTIVNRILETYCGPTLWVLERMVGDEEGTSTFSDEQERPKIVTDKQEDGSRSSS